MCAPALLIVTNGIAGNADGLRFAWSRLVALCNMQTFADADMCTSLKIRSRRKTYLTTGKMFAIIYKKQEKNVGISDMVTVCFCTQFCNRLQNHQSLPWILRKRGETQ